MTKQAKPAPINVPSFAPALNKLTAAIKTAAIKRDAIEGKLIETASAVFEQYRVALINADVPRDLAGSKAIRAAVNKARKESLAFTNLTASGVYKSATLSNYCTSLILCWANGVEFRASAFLSEANGGLKRPDWWPVKAAQPSAEAESEAADEAPESDFKAPGPLEVTNERTVGLEATALIGHVRKIHGDAVADKLCDALIDIIPGFRITV